MYVMYMSVTFFAVIGNCVTVWIMFALVTSGLSLLHLTQALGIPGLVMYVFHYTCVHNR